MQLYRTYAEALADVASHADGAFVDALADETRDGDHTRYEVVDGALVYALNLDRWKAELANSDDGKGAALVRYKQKGTGAVPVDVLSALISVFRPEQFGAVVDGVTDDYQALQKCWDVAFAYGGRVELPYGMMATGKGLIAKVDTLGHGKGLTVIKALAGSWARERTPNATDNFVTSYEPIIQVGAKPADDFTPKAHQTLARFSVRGLMTRPSALTADRETLGFLGDGVHIADSCKAPVFSEVDVQYCQNGFNAYNKTGHVTWDKCTSTNNFHGLLVDHSSGDYRMDGGDWDGNMFSSFCIHGDPAESRTVGGVSEQPGIFGWYCDKTHMGFGPFCVFQPDRGVAVRGMVDCNWGAISPEAVGNRAIQLSPTSTSARNVFGTIGMSFSGESDSTYTVASMDAKDYPFVFGVVTGDFVIKGLNAPVGTSGYVGKIEALQGTLEVLGAHRYWHVVSGPWRCLDPSFIGFAQVQAVASGVAISGTPQTVATISVPEGIRKADRLNVCFEMAAITAAALPSFAIAVWGGNSSGGTDSVQLNIANHPVNTPRDFVGVNVIVAPSGYQYLFVRVVNGSGATMGAGTSGLATLSVVRRAV